jgi:hypothetical protein
MAKDFNQIFDDILNDTKSVAVAAIKNASKQVQKDVCEQAEKNLKAYYQSYSPKRYERTNRLRRAILPYYADRSNANNICIEIGVQYKSSALTGAYKSNSFYHQGGDNWVSRTSGGFNFNSSNNGIPQPEWILNNFWEGIHPTTKFVGWIDEESGCERREYVYSPVQTESQFSLMEKFYNTVLKDKIGDYVNSAIENAILSKFN